MRILVGRPDVVETASDARRMVCTVLQSVERPGSAGRVFYTAPFCWGGWPGRLELVGMVRAAGVPIRRGSPPDAVPRPVRQGPLKKPGLLKKGQRLPLVVIGRL